MNFFIERSEALKKFIKKLAIKINLFNMTRITEQFVKLACSVCKNQNYRVKKNKKQHKDKLALKKYCPKCRKHNVHNEVK